jgi:hypothetical protein
MCFVLVGRPQLLGWLRPVLPADLLVAGLESLECRGARLLLVHEDTSSGLLASQAALAPLIIADFSAGLSEGLLCSVSREDAFFAIDPQFWLSIVVLRIHLFLVFVGGRIAPSVVFRDWEA